MCTFRLHIYTVVCSAGRHISLVYYIVVVLERNFCFGLFLKSLHINWPTSTAIVLLAKSGQLYRAEIIAENFTAQSAHLVQMKQTQSPERHLPIPIDKPTKYVYASLPKASVQHVCFYITVQ